MNTRMLGGGGGFGREFSLRNSLKGGDANNVNATPPSSSIDGGEADFHHNNSSTAARHRKIQNNVHSPPSPSPYAAVPLRTTQSFGGSTTTSSPTRNPHLQQQRRSANYRNIPKKTGALTKHGHSSPASGGHSAAAATSGSGRWNFPGLSPANSMDSAEQKHHSSSFFSTSSHKTTDQFAMSLQTSSFDDCYSPRTPGYHDAFALLEGVDQGRSDEPAKDTSIIAKTSTASTTPSPRDGGAGRAFFPSSPTRHRQYHQLHPSHNSSPTAESPSSVLPSPTRRPPQSHWAGVTPNNPSSTPKQKIVASHSINSTNHNTIEQRLLTTPGHNITDASMFSTSATKNEHPLPPPQPTSQPRTPSHQSTSTSKTSPNSPPPKPSMSDSSSSPLIDKIQSMQLQQKLPQQQQQHLNLSPQQLQEKEQQEQQQQQKKNQEQQPSQSNVVSTIPSSRTASPRRHPSPLNGASQVMKQSISRTWSKAKMANERSRSNSGTRGGMGVGGNNGRSGYSSAVNKLLREEGGVGENENEEEDNKLVLIGVDDGGKSSSSSGIPRSPLSNSESGGRNSDPLWGKEEEQQTQTRRGGDARTAGSRVKNRSPSPIRQYLGRLSVGKFTTSQQQPQQKQQPQQHYRQQRPQQHPPDREHLPLQKPPLSPEKLSHSSVDSDDMDEDTNDDLMVKSMVQNTTMSFDVESPNAADASMLQSTPISPASRKNQQRKQDMFKSSIQESCLEDNDEEGYYINTASFNIFESRQFLVAMGGIVSEASLATNYIRTGDSLCAGNKEDNFHQAIQVYYAGLGVILARIKEWLLQRSDGELTGRSSSSERLIESQLSKSDSASHITYHDLLTVAHNSEMNLLLLAMSSILLRVGNSHFRLKQYELACQDYVSAQCYRVLRHEAKDIISDEKTRQSESYIEDAKLNGRISNNMASAQSKQGKSDEARSEYTKALQIKQSTLEALHNGRNAGKDVDKKLISDIASTFHNIGLLRMKCGEPKKAEKAFKQSLSLRVKKFGLNDMGISSTLNALGGLYYHQKQFDDAFRSYKESLRIWKSHSDKSDLKIAEYYYNIGLVFFSKGPFVKAMSAVAECLRIRRERLAGNERLPLASALHLQGLIATSLGSYDEALVMFQESYAIRQELLPHRDHLLLSNVKVAMGIVYQKKKQMKDAMDCFSVALEDRSHRLGWDHDSVSEVLHAIGLIYTDSNEHRKALKVFEAALRIRKGTKSSSLGVAETLNALGVVYFKVDNTEKAINTCEEALSILKHAVDFDHILVAQTLKNAGDYYQYTGAYDDAMGAFNESYRIMTEFYGTEHVCMSEILNELGVIRFKKGDFMVSKQLFTEALRLMRLSRSESNMSAIFSTLNHLGHALYKNNELDLAAEVYIESFNIQVSIVTGVPNTGLEEFGTQLNAIKDRVFTLRQEKKDVTELSESLGGIANILRFLGLVIQEQGDFEAALSTNKLALSVRMCQPFKDQSAIALIAETIAMFEYKRNNLGSAMDYFNQALEAKKISQGESTIDVARTVNNLANIHFSLGNLDNAMKLYQEALEIKKHCLGDDSDEVANTLNNIAHVMVNAGREQDALKAYNDVLKIRQERHGKSHASVASTLASMGDVCIKLRKLDTAKAYFEQCLRIQKMLEVPCDERVMENLGSIYGKLGEWPKAESTFKEIIELKRSTHGDECLDIAKSLDLLAVSYIERDRYADSIPYLEEALRVRKACLDDDDDEILASLNKLAFVYKSLNMIDQMLEIRTEFDAIQDRKQRTMSYVKST